MTCVFLKEACSFPKGEYDRRCGRISPLPLLTPVVFFMKLFDRLTDLNLMYDSAIKCMKGVGWKASVQKYKINCLKKNMKTAKSVMDGTYRQKKFHEFVINERGKMRNIRSLHISDRVLQRNLCDNILNPVFRPYLIYDNGASIKGKGIEFSRKRLKVHLSKYYRKHGKDGYVLLIDFSKYFDNILHKKLIEMMSEKIRDENVMKLVSDLIHTFDTNGNEKSVGIGSQISQTAGIFYPTKVDNLCKIVHSCKYYGRYMDDTYIIHNDRKFLEELLVKIRDNCRELGIIINEKKTQIVPVKNGFTFLKMRYIITDTGKICVIPCRKTVTRERRKLRKLYKKVLTGSLSVETVNEQYRSWRGNIIKYNSHKSILGTDALYKSLFGGKWNERRNQSRND